MQRQDSANAIHEITLHLRSRKLPVTWELRPFLCLRKSLPKRLIYFLSSETIPYTNLPAHISHSHEQR
jgi:hypothetical protein